MLSPSEPSSPSSESSISTSWDPLDRADRCESSRSSPAGCDWAEGCCGELNVLLNGEVGKVLFPLVPRKLFLVGVVGADASLTWVGCDREVFILSRKPRGVVGVVTSLERSLGPRPILTD